MIPRFSAPLVQVVFASVLGMEGACARSSAGTPDARQPTTSDAAPEKTGAPSPKPAEKTATTPLALACGRARAEIPGDFVVDRKSSIDCKGLATGEAIDAVGVKGLTSDHILQRGTCTIALRAIERVPVPKGVEQLDYQRSALDGTIFVTSADGSSFEINALPFSAACQGAPALVLATIQASLRVVPVREHGATVHATLSSVGHSMQLEVPDGFSVASGGGMTNAYESAYQLRGPGDAWATIYAPWRQHSKARSGAASSALLGERVRWRPAQDPATDVKGCQSTSVEGLEKRAKVQVVMCGPSDGYPALEAVLRSVRLVAAGAGAEQRK